MADIWRTWQLLHPGRAALHRKKGCSYFSSHWLEFLLLPLQVRFTFYGTFDWTGVRKYVQPNKQKVFLLRDETIWTDGPQQLLDQNCSLTKMSQMTSLKTVF